MRIGWDGLRQRGNSRILSPSRIRSTRSSYRCVDGGSSWTVQRGWRTGDGEELDQRRCEELDRGELDGDRRWGGAGLAVR
jgi:hypothetical protein